MGTIVKWIPIVPLQPFLFKPRKDWFARHKYPWMDRYEQAWELDKSFWKIIVIQRDSWFERMYKDAPLRRAMRKDGTLRVIRSLQQLATGMSKKHEGGNGVTAVKGQKRVGKTFLAKIWAKIWQAVMREEFGYDAEIHLTFSRHKIPKIMKHCNPGDHILCDESAKLTSQGAITTLINITNLLEITGVQQIGVTMVGPNFDFKSVGGALDFGFEHFGSNFDNEMARCVVYDKNAEPLYLAGFQRNFLKNEFPSYDVEKREKALSIIEDEGAEEAWDPEQFEEDVARLVEFAKEEYAFMLSKKRLPKVSTLAGDGKSLKIRGNITYMKSVASKVKDKLDNYVCAIPDEKKGTIHIPDIPEGEEEEFHPILPYLAVAAEAVLSQDKFRAKDKARQRFKRYFFDGMKFSEIAELELDEDPEAHRVTANNIGKVVRGLRNKIPNKDVGDIGELAVQKFLQDQFPHTLIARGVRCGCLDKEDDDIDLGIGGAEGSEDFVAVNVKLFLSEREGSVIHTSPEFRHDPHMTVVIEVKPLKVSVLLNAAEAETQVRAEQDGRLVDLEGMLDILQFSRGMKRSGKMAENPGEEESHTAV